MELFERKIPVGLWCEGAEVNMVPSTTYRRSRRNATADVHSSGGEWSCWAESLVAWRKGGDVCVVSLGASCGRWASRRGEGRAGQVSRRGKGRRGTRGGAGRGGSAGRGGDQ